MAVKSKKKSKAISKEAKVLTTQFADQELNAACLKALRIELTSGLRTRWTADSSGETNSPNVSLEAMKAFLRHHPRTAQGLSVGVSHCDADAARVVLKRMAAKREGRVAGFDPMVIRTLIKVNAAANRPTRELKELLTITSKRVVRKDRSRIKTNADVYRKALLAYLIATPLPKTPARALSYARERALLLILLHIPLRRGTLHLAQRAWFQNKTIVIPKDGIKTRENVTVPLPGVVSKAIEDYLALRSDDEPSLFANNDGSPIAKNNLYLSIYRRTQKALNLDKGLGIHSFRHILATSASRKIGSEAVADLLIITQKTLRECYDLADSEMRISSALTKLETV